LFTPKSRPLDLDDRAVSHKAHSVTIRVLIG
jgi:hypothetical protein